MNARKVELPGHGIFWLIGGALAPLHHCDEQGELVLSLDTICDLGNPESDSYAHIYGDVVMRHGNEIGRTSDLRDVPLVDEC